LMTDFFTKSELDKIRAAVNIEIKHQYIDIKGRECPFSTFMIRQIKKILKIVPNNAKWETMLKCFEYYPYDDYISRKKTLNQFIALMKKELSGSEEKTAPKSNDFSDNIYNKDVTYIRGVGPKTAVLMNKIGIFNLYDLITYYPKRYIDYSSRVLIKDLTVGQDVTIFGTITGLSTYNTKKQLTVLHVKISDETGSIKITFFYAKVNRFMIERYKKQFPVGSHIMISGKVKFDNFSRELTLTNTEYQIVDGDFLGADSLNLGRIVPVYSLCENLNIKALRKAISNALTDYGDKIKNVVPDFIREKYQLTDKVKALEAIHFPKTFQDAETARTTLVFEELFVLEVKMGLIKNDYVKSVNAKPLVVQKDGLVEKFLKSLPFELTNAQKNAINEIFNDINSGKPMQRLLQGDVGSGKTVVACTMLLAAIENGYQTAIMAPTEILAAQHFNNFVSLLTPLGICTALFTSTNSKKARKELEISLRNGQIDVAVGTHALIQDNIEFKNLGAVIIDEQHRFGVKQRNALKNKATVPQMLTMSATPIPRTLALTVHGDLDLTVIDELPAGRKEIITTLIKNSQRKKAYDLIRAEVSKGHQAYIVFPLIEESETISAKAATKEAEELRNGVFSDLKVGLLHGKMKPDEKDEVMQDFKDKKYDVLVSTTVVEVGVDVPNATVMVIENAERFGLSQLHQLRGRVGRNSLQSYCVLVSSSSSQDTLTRLNIMTQTNDGFIIAEKDLEIRGPGEFLGLRQSGIPELNLTDLTKDIKILEQARKSAIEFLKNNNIDDFEEIKRMVNQNLGFTKDVGIPD
ncbi:MAG: ATP-dependent DNA helicase RecG, partial [Candidatus Gastranaerophilales bacterium]|nr:ATP-dependent DNA helicase RecG [Candidatus Gastranaerophilales bacterium]